MDLKPHDLKNVWHMFRYKNEKKKMWWMWVSVSEHLNLSAGLHVQIVLSKEFLKLHFQGAEKTEFGWLRYSLDRKPKQNTTQLGKDNSGGHLPFSFLETSECCIHVDVHVLQKIHYLPVFWVRRNNSPSDEALLEEYWGETCPKHLPKEESRSY